MQYTPSQNNTENYVPGEYAGERERERERERARERELHKYNAFRHRSPPKCNILNVFV